MMLIIDSFKKNIFHDIGEQKKSPIVKIGLLNFIGLNDYLPSAARFFISLSIIS